MNESAFFPRSGQGRLALKAGDLNSICRAIIDGRRAARTLAVWTARFELSEAEFLVLWCLRDTATAGIDQTTIAERLALSPAQVSATAERLRASGRIVPRSAAGDRRRHLWQLSAAGRTLLEIMFHNAHGSADMEAA
jgi:DNA-binding MarR family transcriptional regulator